MKQIRYRVTGEKDGIPCGSVFKNLQSAKKFADKLTNSEVYDIETREYIFGTSRFVAQLLYAKEQSSN